MKDRNLVVRDYRTVQSIQGPLLCVERVPRAAYGEHVTVLGDGAPRHGQVIAVSDEHAVVQVLEGTSGLDVDRTTVRFEGRLATIGLSPDLLGRVLDGAGRPLDGLPPIAARVRRAVAGRPINPMARDLPSDFIETGVSAIDGLNTLVRGQKLPVFSSPGLPAPELAARIVRHARVRDTQAPFAVVFATMGVTHREADFFHEALVERGALHDAVLFLNHANDPVVERLLTPRCALTVAEYLAFDLGRHVLVVMMDMTWYCEALREVAAARNEIPGRRGYPGYMYTDLATIYERAGRLRGLPGSVTQIPILTMPDGDITHPVPDLTGYITEGQIVLSHDLHARGVDPPIDVLPSLSRLMRKGIGPGRTRGDHGPLADQMYALYARGREARQLATVVGEGGLASADSEALRFADTFERRFVHQGHDARGIDETLECASALLAELPAERLTRLPSSLLTALKSPVA